MAKTIAQPYIKNRRGLKPLRFFYTLNTYQHIVFSLPIKSFFLSFLPIFRQIISKSVKSTGLFVLTNCFLTDRYQTIKNMGEDCQVIKNPNQKLYTNSPTAYWNAKIFLLLLRSNLFAIRKSITKIQKHWLSVINIGGLIYQQNLWWLIIAIDCFSNCKRRHIKCRVKKYIY